MDDLSLKVLISDSEPLPEMGGEIDGTDDLIANAEMNSSFIDIILSIGTPEFQYIFNNLINDIKELDIKDQITLCIHIIDRIKEVYGFEFLEKIDLSSIEDVNNVYDFIKFLEYDNVDFLTYLFSGIIIDIRKEPVRMILDKNWSEIESKILSGNFSRLIYLFLRTNNKEDLLDFLTSKATKNKTEITMNLLERSS
jgi:hypothetical protein